MEDAARIFTPLKDAVNDEFNNINARRMCEILMLRYFYYFNEKTLNKVFSALLSGEDVEKKELLVRKHIIFVKKFEKKFREVTFRAEKNFTTFKKFLTKKRVSFSELRKKFTEKVKGKVADVLSGIAARMKRKRAEIAKKNIQENIKKNRDRLTHLQQHQTQMMAVLQQIREKKDEFKTKYQQIIENPEDYTFATEAAKNEFITDANTLDTLSKIL